MTQGWHGENLIPVVPAIEPEPGFSKSDYYVIDKIPGSPTRRPGMTQGWHGENFFPVVPATEPEPGFSNSYYYAIDKMSGSRTRRPGMTVK